MALFNSVALNYVTCTVWLILASTVVTGGAQLNESSGDLQAQCLDLAAPPNGFIISVSSLMVSLSCNHGYHVNGVSIRTCRNGVWDPTEPLECLPNQVLSLECQTKPLVRNGSVKYKSSSVTYPMPSGSRAEVVCDAGYSGPRGESVFGIECSQHGLWMTAASNSLDILCRELCPSPPSVPHATSEHQLFSVRPNSNLVEVKYTCHHNFMLVDSDNDRLVCRNGEWDGSTPTCVPRKTCDTPASVINGKWAVKSRRSPVMSDLSFDVGVEIRYTCHPGYKLSGPGVLRCIASSQWSSEPPDCIPESEHTWFCPELLPLPNGDCWCAGVEGSRDLGRCMPFRRGARVQCSCKLGFSMQGSSLLTCVHEPRLVNVGVWDKLPSCVRFTDSEDLVDIPPYNGDRGRPYSSADITDEKNKVSSMVIVVTTACSVLFILLIIMAVMVFRRRKPHLRGSISGAGTHLFSQGPTSPPYARVHSTLMEEHDRLALMAYAEASRVHLPTYEEAMRHGNSSVTNDATLFPGGGVGVALLPSVDYRNSAGNSLVHHSNHQQTWVPNTRPVGHNPMAGLNDGNNNINNNNNNNRHSTVTTGSGGVATAGMYRDGVSVSEMFGSIDTVNVSMSDASTAVTVETYDSGTSCGRSVGSTSQQATAGSLSSSHNQLADDDAPLLDSNSQQETDVVSMNSIPSRTSKEEQ